MGGWNGKKNTCMQEEKRVRIRADCSVSIQIIIKKYKEVLKKGTKWFEEKKKIE